MNNLFKLKTKIRRSLNATFSFERPSSYPFISGDGFRCMAQHMFDDISDFDPELVEMNDIVFVRSDFLKVFFKSKHPLIKNRYILISHNDDTNIDESYAAFIDDKILHWFAQNLLFKNKKITPIPIGIQNLRHHHIGKLNYFDQKDISKEGEISIRYGFSMQSGPERISAEKNLKESPLAKKIEIDGKDGYMDRYMETIRKSLFVASPAGRGIDCHRTWEAIYLKCIPILVRNPMTEYFKSIGLPMILMDSWNDLKSLTKESLEKEYNNARMDDLFPPMFMDYWQKEVRSIKYNTMRIYDCFTFFNELDLLEMRLHILDDAVEHFVLVESTKTHSGETKELVFQKNKDRFSAFSKKIIHIVVSDMPKLDDGNRWVLENFQRDAISRGLSGCRDDDIILISDLDEIPDLQNISRVKKILIKNKTKNELLYNIFSSLKKRIQHAKDAGKFIRFVRKVFYRFPIKSKMLISFKQRFYYYYLNGYINSDWIGTKAVLYGDLTNHFNSSPQQIRDSSSKETNKEGGWHFSYLLTPEEIAKKIKAFAHSEFDKKEFTDISAIKKRITEGEDLFDRKEKIFYVKIDSSYPKWISENTDRYSRYINKNYSSETQNHG